MIVSEARITANRLNSLKSTGPRTAAGKERSRANALTHGLCASVVVPEDAELVQVRSADYFTALKPQNELHNWMIDRVAILSIRIDRCERIERRVRDRVSLRAELTWDDDRHLEAEILGGMLAKKPGETVRTLKRTPHGCEWLMTRWAMLAYTADTNHAWTEDQTKLALDMMATPTNFRTGQKPGTSLDFDGLRLDSLDDLAAIARREIGHLKEQRETVRRLDAVDRVLAETDHNNDADPELRRLRRYESGLHRQFRWFITQINSVSPHKFTAPGLQPRWIEEVIPTPQPEPKTAEEIAAESHPAGSIHPPFDLTDEECPIGTIKPPDIPTILNARKEKRLAKAQARRDARRRKVERLRA